LTPYAAAGVDEIYSQGLSLALNTYRGSAAVAQNTYDVSAAGDYASAVADWAASQPGDAHRQYLAGVAAADLAWQTAISTDWLDWMEAAADADRASSDAQALATKQNTLAIALADQAYSTSLATADETQSRALADAEDASQTASAAAAAQRLEAGALAEGMYGIGQAEAEVSVP
jgi:hypothetical protein